MSLTKFYSDEINFYKDVIDLKETMEVAKSLDEALYVCDLSCVVKKYDLWCKLLPNVKPFYAVKCNDNAWVVKMLAELGTGFDCASKNEIKQILDIGVAPDRILFANPCKPISHISYAREEHVHTTTVDNECEIYKLFKHYPEANLVIRFRCEAKDAQCPLGDKFGCDADNDAAALMLLAKSLQMNVVGTSFHVGSGCNDLPAYDRAIKTAKKLFLFGKELGFDMRVLDIGGGFPGSDDEKFAKIAKIVNDSLEENFPNRERMEIIAEPGRFFVASAFLLLCKIHSKKEVRINGKLDTKMYYVNDGVYGSFNCILYDHQVVTPIHFLDESHSAEELPKYKSLIWGPTCDALDKIGENFYIPDLCCGEFIGFPNMGAYTMSIASPFNGFTLPKTLYFMKSSFHS